jgi:uncharacterized membrane protein YbaN (DUF454 family)
MLRPILLCTGWFCVVAGLVLVVNGHDLIGVSGLVPAALCFARAQSKFSRAAA